MSINQRIIKETQKLKTDPIVGIYAEPVQDTPRHFNFMIPQVLQRHANRS